MELQIDMIAECVFNVVTGVADRTERPKRAAESLLAVLKQSIQFKTDPIAYHLSQIAQLIILETTLAPKYLDSFPLTKIDYTVSDCSRSRWPVAHVHNSLRKDILSPIIHFGIDGTVQTAAKQIDSHCPISWEAPSMPFVDDPLCNCKNCGITI